MELKTAGYDQMRLQSGLGPIHVEVPRDRNSSFESSVDFQIKRTVIF